MVSSVKTLNLLLLVTFLTYHGQVMGADKLSQGHATTKEVAKSPVGGKVSINTADAQTLSAKLNGVGTKKAQAIVEYREKYGLFTDIKQLQEVPGFGESLVQRNIALISL